MIHTLFSHASGSSTGQQGNGINVKFLRDCDHGGPADQPSTVAKLMLDYVHGAKSSIYICIYDFRLSQELGGDLVQELIRKAEAGLDVRVAYDHTKPKAKTAAPFAALGSDPAPKGTHIFVGKHFKGTKVQTKAVGLTMPEAVADSQVTTEPIAGSHLMHNKYVIRDVDTSEASILSGSTNFTDDAWTHQENNIIIIPSPALATYYATDFRELWTSENIASTGVNDVGDVQFRNSEVEVAFAPGEGPTIDGHLSSLVSAARSRIKVCSMVISSQKILGALSDAITTKQVAEFNGIYDATQMDNVLRMWEKNGNPAAKTFDFVAKRLQAKHSAPYTENGLHNFMHDKILVCDDVVATGSFNLSSNATKNAENSLIIHDKSLATQYSAYIDEVEKAYKK